MAFKHLITAASAVALIVSPTVAAATTAPAAAPQELAPATETVEEGSELRRTGFIIPLAVIIAIILGILLLTGGDKEPVGP